MGFQINGTTVLDSNGIQNYTNSFKTLDGNTILGSGNITDSGPADALIYGKVGVYTWANYLPPSTPASVTNVDTTATVAAGGTVAASHIGKPEADFRFDYFVGILEPSQSQVWNNLSSSAGRGDPCCITVYTGYSGTYRNMLTEKKGRYASLWIRIS
ncbi:hypothetical protein [uncultured Mediterranean phage uvMED]|nr:hypothetical protein [uncultured Mediterranean phage uvMED]BAR19729.1 hypothetical protein [uncultured Mediterranean phage uvMED]BAR19776.1 hypothetical protein [uncultured Mediterranean phage uvMED]